MKRNMDLARQILLDLEKKEDGFDYPDIQYEPEGEYRSVEIAYHVKLLSEAGLIHAMHKRESMGNSHTQWWPICLTWTGHEFLEAARDDTNWNKAKKLVKEKSGGIPFDVLKAMLILWAKQAVGL